MFAHPIKTAADLFVAAFVAAYLFLFAHWIPVMNGLAATLVTATVAVRFASAVRDYRRGRAAGEP